MLDKRRIFFQQVLAILLILGPSYGATEPRVERQQQDIISQEQQRLKDLFSRSRDLSPPQKPTQPSEPATSESASPQFLFKEIALKGVTRLPDEAVHELLEPYRNKPLSIDQINDMLSKVTSAYIDRGYVTARVYLGNQNLRSGRLVLTVIEGKVGVCQQIHNGKERAFRNHIMPQDPEGVLNLRDLEQATDHLARLETYEVTSDIQPTDTVGESQIILHTTQEKPFVLQVSRDMNGSRSTGINQGEAQVALEDILGLYERLSATYRRDLDFESGDHFSKSLTFQGAIPYRLWHFTYLGSLFEYRSTQRASAFDYRLEGQQRTHRLEAQYLLHRDGVSKTNVLGFVSHRKTTSHIEGERLRTASYNLSLVGVGATHVRRFLGGVLSGTWQSSVSQDHNPNLAQDSGRYYSKHTLDVSYSRPFTFLGGRWRWEAEASGQYAPKDLSSLERFSIGGDASVRGFRDTSVTGSSGFFLKHELIWVLFTPETALWRERFGEVSLFQGFDYGWIRPHRTDPYERGKLLSASAGIRVKGGHLWGDAMVARSLSRPAFLKKESTLFKVRIGVKI